VAEPLYLPWGFDKYGAEFHILWYFHGTPIKLHIRY